MKRFVLLLLAASAAAAQAAETLPLAGAWRFRLDEAKAGVDGRWFAAPLAGDATIPLPGTIDAAGLGPTNTAAPTLEGPYRIRDYAGPAWYQRDVEIPAGWQGKRVTLFLERCRWVTTAWLDDRRIGSQDSLIAPHMYDLGTAVAPGRHRLTLCVDNTVKLNLGRFVSALFGGTQGNLNGIVGRIELAATPPVWIDDVQVYPNVTQRIARVTVKVANATGRAGKGTVRVAGTWGVGAETHPISASSSSFEWSANGAYLNFNVELPPDVKAWDEFTPALLRFDVTLDAGAGATDARHVVAGLRDFAARGTQFTINGRPVYLRGTLECQIFPLTGHPPMETGPWKRIYGILKSYGLNHIRFHSWCPPEAAFAAADEEGIMIQAEAPQANVPAGSDPARDAFTEAELLRIVRTYGNHPSFCTMTLGNEYGGKDEVLTRWVDLLIREDPRHLYSSASCAQKTENRQWTELASGRGIHGQGTQHDLRDVVAGDARPIVGHEIGQWMYYPDFNEMKKYTGVLAPRNFQMIRDDLERKGQLDLAPRYVQASGRFATLLYKEEIEVLLRTPGYAGFSLLDLHDYPMQGTALIGPLDPFWDSKGFVEPGAFRRYCGPTVPLLRMPKRTYRADEPFDATADLSHFGPADLANARPAWRIEDAQGRTVAGGDLPAQTVRTGGLTALGAIHADLGKVAAPAKLKVTVALKDSDVANDWDLWVYPAAADAPKPPDGVTVCRAWDEAKTALAAGRRVVLFPATANPKASMRGRFLPVFWSPVWFPSQKPNTMGLLCDPKHALFSRFPTEFHSDWRWYEPMQHARLFVLDDAPAGYRPLVQVIDNFARNHLLGAIFEARVGERGRLLVCGLDLPALPADPAARQLLESVYAYAASPAFDPPVTFAESLLESLFVAKYANRLQGLGAKVRADSQHGDYEAANAIDGQPDTMWHTMWDDGAPPFPHRLDVELPQPATLTGLTFLPRQDGNPNGWIRTCEIRTSADGKTWSEPVAKGVFPHNAELKTVTFAQPVTTRFLRIVATASFDAAKPYASLAELDAIVKP